jgi:hypothetical protein
VISGSPPALGAWISVGCALAVCAILPGCGGESDRDRVQSYLKEANGIQRRATPAFKRSNDVYRRFATNKIRPSQAARKLAGAERAIRRTRTRLARLDPPRPAAQLHRKLLRVYDLNVNLADETTQLARYLPAAAAALRPVQRINRRLGRELKAAGDPTAQGRALGHYADALRTPVRRLRRLHPPPVLVASDRARVRRLAATRSLASRLRDAIEARDSRRVARLLLRFRRVTRGGGGEAPFSGSSLRAYNRRYFAIAHAAGAVQKERVRLERSL